MPVDAGDHDDAVLHRDTEKGDEPNRRGNVKGFPTHMQSNKTTQRSQRHDAQNEQGMTDLAELDEQEDQHHGKHDAQSNSQALLGAFLLLEGSGPFQRVLFLVVVDGFLNLRLCIGKILRQGTLTVIYADRDLAMAQLMSNVALTHP